MQDSAHDKLNHFSVWLRTGHWPVPQASAALERKFNPWHDPDDGRFTFAGTGRHYGSTEAWHADQPTRRERTTFIPGAGSFWGSGWQWFARGATTTEAEAGSAQTPKASRRVASSAGPQAKALGQAYPCTACQNSAFANRGAQRL